MNIKMLPIFIVFSLWLVTSFSFAASAADVCGDLFKSSASSVLAVFDPRKTDENDLVAEAPLTLENLIAAYRVGIFPWSEIGMNAGWYSPSERGVIDFSEFHISKSLKKDRARYVRDGRYRLAIDENFEAVIQAAADATRPEQDGTWITPQFVRRYIEFHKAGYAHSFEIYIDGKLAGAAYGIFMNGVFAGESMFYIIPNAGKFAFLEMIEYMKTRGLTWMDTQMVTEATEPFGAKYISRDDYLERLKKAQAIGRTFR